MLSEKVVPCAASSRRTFGITDTDATSWTSVISTTMLGRPAPGAPFPALQSPTAEGPEAVAGTVAASADTTATAASRAGRPRSQGGQEGRGNRQGSSTRAVRSFLICTRDFAELGLIRPDHALVRGAVGSAT